MTTRPCRAAATILTAVAVAAALACAPGHARDRDRSLAPVPVGAVLATVTNEDLPDVRLYVLTQTGARWPLGHLRPGATQTFSLPPGLLLPADVRFVGVPMGDGTPRSSVTATVFPGDRVQVTLRAPELLSTLLKVR